MTRLWPSLGIFLSTSILLADEPPLPQRTTQTVAPPSSIEIPTMVIRPPSNAPVVVVPPRMLEVTNEEAIIKLERRLIEEQVRRRIAVAYASGNASALKQLIVMSGPVDASVSRSAKPPVVAGTPIALVGLEKGTVATKNLEQFFGAPMTPDRERELLDTVKSQLAGKDKSKLDVHIAGWWPDEGVMAVSVVSKAGG